MSEVLTRDEILGNFRTGRYHALNDCRWNHFLSLGIPILDKRIFEPGAGVGDQTEWLLSQGAKYIYVNEGRADNRADHPRAFPNESESQHHSRRP